MNQRLALKLASRINALLLRELTQGVDASRMLADPLYARDVLLVCDAHDGSELASLALQFRAAVAEPVTAPAAHRPQVSPNGVAATAHRVATRTRAPEDSGRDSSGFSASRFFSSLFGPVVPLDGDTSQPPRSWFGRSRPPGRPPSKPPAKPPEK